MDSIFYGLASRLCRICLQLVFFSKIGKRHAHLEGISLCAECDGAGPVEEPRAVEPTIPIL